MRRSSRCVKFGKVVEVCLRIVSLCIVALVMAATVAPAFGEKSTFREVARMAATAAMAAISSFRPMKIKAHSEIWLGIATGIRIAANTAWDLVVPDAAVSRP